MNQALPGADVAPPEGDELAPWGAAGFLLGGAMDEQLRHEIRSVGTAVNHALDRLDGEREFPSRDQVVAAVESAVLDNDGADYLNALRAAFPAAPDYVRARLDGFWHYMITACLRPRGQDGLVRSATGTLAAQRAAESKARTECLDAVRSAADTLADAVIMPCVERAGQLRTEKAARKKTSAATLARLAVAAHKSAAAALADAEALLAAIGEDTPLEASAVRAKFVEPMGVFVGVCADYAGRGKRG